MVKRFTDRREGGRALARELMTYANRRDVLVLALPRGGVPVAYEVARALSVPLDLLLVRKLGVPGREELAMGAIATGGVRVIDADLIRALGIGQDEIERAIAREERELKRRERLYRGDRVALPVNDSTLIVVDDGLATGSTMRAAVASLRQRAVARIVVAAPVGAADTCESLAREVDELVCLLRPEAFYAVGLWYENFGQTTDDEVRDFVELAAREQAERARRPALMQRAPVGPAGRW